MLNGRQQTPVRFIYRQTLRGVFNNSCRVGMAHRLAAFDNVGGGRCPPYMCLSQVRGEMLKGCCLLTLTPTLSLKGEGVFAMICFHILNSNPKSMW